MSTSQRTVLASLETKGFEITFLSHAKAILSVDFPGALHELFEALDGLTIPIEEIIGSGGGEAKGTQRLRRALAARNWHSVNFEITKSVNGVAKESISHKMDHVRTFGDIGTVALEIEWNNKDPFFDRDLENFKRLHAEGAISVGIVITRGTTMQDKMKSLVSRFVAERQIEGFAQLEPYGIAPTRRQKQAVTQRTSRKLNPLSFREAWTDHFVNDKFGSATTHWRKLDDRVRRGVGNPCPLLLIGLPASIVTFDEEPTVLNEVLDADSDSVGD